MYVHNYEDTCYLVITVGVEEKSLKVYLCLLWIVLFVDYCLHRDRIHLNTHYPAFKLDFSYNVPFWTRIIDMIYMQARTKYFRV